MQSPLRVAASAPGMLVPPRYAVTGILRRERRLVMVLILAVLTGRTTRAGI